MQKMFPPLHPSEHSKYGSGLLMTLQTFNAEKDFETFHYLINAIPIVYRNIIIYFCANQQLLCRLPGGGSGSTVGYTSSWSG